MTENKEFIKKLYDKAQDFEGASISGVLVQAGDTILTQDSEITKLREEVESLKSALRQAGEALKEIKKGEGAFSLDHLTHANNTIENMKSLAEDPLSSPLIKQLLEEK